MWDMRRLHGFPEQWVIPIFYFNKEYQAIAAIQLLGKKIQIMRGNVLKK